MVSDARAMRAREAHRRASDADELAGRHRAERDHLVRTLRADDPQWWTYSALAAAVGCSPELIALIVKGPASVRAADRSGGSRIETCIY